jgi:hypothetical protein
MVRCGFEIHHYRFKRADMLVAKKGEGALGAWGHVSLLLFYELIIRAESRIRDDMYHLTI